MRPLRLTLPALLLVLAAAVPSIAAQPVAGAADPVPREGDWPLSPATVVRGFEPPSGPYGPGHRGVDLLGAPGQAVHAALGGTVTFAGRLAGRGVVVVDHGETRTTYEPVDAAVRRGEAVARAAVLGRLEAAPSHCRPRACLHWGWRRGETYLDPLGLVDGGPVRLLPLAGLRERAPRGSTPTAGAGATSPGGSPVPSAAVGSAATAALPLLGPAGLALAQARGWAWR